MNIKDLYPFVLIMISIGMLLGIGIVVTDTFGDAVKEDANIVNESVAFINFAGSTANDEVTAVSYFGNSTFNCAPANNACVNFTEAGALTANATFVNGSYDVSYTYDRDTAGTTAMGNVVSALTPIASTWLPLIVTVFILAIILSLVIMSFTQGRK